MGVGSLNVSGRIGRTALSIEFGRLPCLFSSRLNEPHLGLESDSTTETTLGKIQEQVNCGPEQTNLNLL